MITLTSGEYIVTAYADPASGHGWSNSPLWVLIADAATGRIREVALQPSEQPPEMRTLYAVSAAVHASLIEALKPHIVRVPS